MPVEETPPIEEAERGFGRRATSRPSGSEQRTRTEAVAWPCTTIQLDVRKGRNFRTHFFFDGKHASLLTNAQAVVREATFTADLQRINAELETAVVDNKLIGWMILLFHLSLWTLVGVGVNRHWDTHDSAFVAVLIVTLIGLVAGNLGIVLSASDCSESGTFHTLMRRLQNEILPAMNDAHKSVQTGEPWKWELEGDVSIISTNNKILRSETKTAMKQAFRLKVSWPPAAGPATRRQPHLDGTDDLEAGGQEGRASFNSLLSAITNARAPDDLHTALMDIIELTESQTFQQLRSSARAEFASAFLRTVTSCLRSPAATRARGAEPGALWSTSALTLCSSIVAVCDMLNVQARVSLLCAALNASGSTEDLLACTSLLQEIFTCESILLRLTPDGLDGMLQEVRQAAIGARTRVGTGVWTPPVVAAYAALLAAMKNATLTSAGGVV